MIKNPSNYSKLQQKLQQVTGREQLHENGPAKCGNDKS